MMEGARRHVHRAHVTTLALEVAPADFLLKVAAIQGAPPERMDVRVTRAGPTRGTSGQRLLDWVRGALRARHDSATCCLPLPPGPWQLS